MIGEGDEIFGGGVLLTRYRMKLTDCPCQGGELRVDASFHQKGTRFGRPPSRFPLRGGRSPAHLRTTPLTSRIAGRHHLGISGRLRRNLHTTGTGPRHFLHRQRPQRVYECRLQRYIQRTQPDHRSSTAQSNVTYFPYSDFQLHDSGISGPCTTTTAVRTMRPTIAMHRRVTPM